MSKGGQKQSVENEPAIVVEKERESYILNAIPIVIFSLVDSSSI